ncbi:MAG: transcription initiation protein [Gemmatimonadetes bacterium]|nr:transcription initiation protein [Gemmatimonadota bacterium]MBK7786233.1 transcription initiation protein [Gemmatimonadota bacterium]
MPSYLLLLHEDPATFAELSPADMQAIVARYADWTRRMAEAGKLTAGVKLRDGVGRRVGRDAAGRVTDGPFTETKDVVGGYFAVVAPDLAGALAIARDCPHVDNGWVEVREVEIGEHD